MREQNGIPVSVDSDFARIGAKSYAINKINSVEIKKRHPNGQGLAFVVSLAAIALLVGHLYTGGVLVGAFAAWLWWRSRMVEYELHLTTSSSEIAAFKSADLDFVDKLRTQIEAAMAQRAH